MNLFTAALMITGLHLLAGFGAAVSGSEVSPPLRPHVEVEEDVYHFVPADNGAGPMWCHGSSCLVRMGETVFASGLETLKDAKPLNNCRWMLFQRDRNGWQKVCVDATGRTREPCPLAAFPTNRLFLSANPTLVPDINAYAGPARPEILEFSTSDPTRPMQAFQTFLPPWKGNPPFSEHSYRSLAADGPSGHLVLFQNIGYTHAEWAFMNGNANWSVQGQLQWPWGAEYDQPQPIRVCYPNVALQNRAVYFCGVSDVQEPNLKWRAYKKELTGRDWDYDFRRLFYTWTPDITCGTFRPWIELASRERTGGWITPGDLWVAPDGLVHIVWTERALDERLRPKFFPTEKQSHALNYAVVRKDQIVLRRTLCLAEEGKSNEVPGRGRFHVTPDHRLFVLCYVSGSDREGHALAENRLLEIKAGGEVGPSVRVPLKRPFTEFFTATPRAGSPPTTTLDLLGLQAGSSTNISYARIGLF